LAEKIYTTTGWRAVICGGKDEEELGQRLTKLSHTPLHNIAGKTSLSDLVNIINKAELLVANETGSVHIAAAVGTPVVCILGGGHYGRFMPYQVEKETSRQLPVTVTYKMPCFNCNWQCIYKTDRNAPFPCIKNISVGDVWAQARILIEQISRKQATPRRPHGREWPASITLSSLRPSPKGKRLKRQRKATGQADDYREN
jgi:ADP-heptose:LPS heptosyltransferase